MLDLAPHKHMNKTVPKNNNNFELPRDLLGDYLDASCYMRKNRTG